MKERGANNTPAVKTTAVAGAGDREEQHKATSGTEAEMVALQQALAFFKVGFEDYKLYRDREEEDEVEEYRQTGKLHTYDPDREWKKRLARVAKLHPPPDHMVEGIKLYTYYLEEDEDDVRIGLHSLIDE